MKNLVLITGASKGLGLELAKLALDCADCLITVSRSPITSLEELAKSANCNFISENADLSKPADIDRLADELKDYLKAHSFERILLINNAGTLGPVASSKKLAETTSADLTAGYTLNVVAGMRLSSVLLAHGGQSDIKILNISSGAGRYAVPGWSFYCSSKAALDRYSQVAAEEHPNAKIVAIAPGVIDTGMQKTIRSSGEEDFPQIQKFRELHSSGSLSSPEDTAAAIYKFINSDSFGKETLDDIRNYTK